MKVVSEIGVLLNILPHSDFIAQWTETVGFFSDFEVAVYSFLLMMYRSRTCR